MSEDIELRKWAIDKAASMLTIIPDRNPIELARELFEFLSPPSNLLQMDRPDPVQPSHGEDDFYTRTHKLRPLSPIEKALLKITIDLYREQGKITGTEIGRAARYEFPASANAFIKKLHIAGYVRREGWFVTPILDCEGNKLPPVVQRLPDGVAKGYTPMTAKLGEVGRIS